MAEPPFSLIVILYSPCKRETTGNCGILSELGDLSTEETSPKHAGKVWEVVGRSLVLKGEVAVWGADGRLVGRYGPGRVSLRPGIYFLTYGDGRAKVVIR